MERERFWMGKWEAQVGQAELEVPTAQARVSQMCTPHNRLPAQNPLNSTCSALKPSSPHASRSLFSWWCLNVLSPPISQARRSTQHHPWLIPLPQQSSMLLLNCPSPSLTGQAWIKITTHLTVLLIAVAFYCLGDCLKASESVWNPYLISSY